MSIIHKWLVSVLLFTLWSTDAFEWYHGEYNRVKWTRNCDDVGGDIGNEPSRSEFCGRLCFRKPECTRFTWTHYNGGTCWLKNGHGNAVSVQNRGVCGYVIADKLIMEDIAWVIDNDGQIRWAYDCNISGGTLEIQHTNDTHCGPACLSLQNCIGFVWSNYEGGTCWLKSRGYPLATPNIIGTVCGEVIGRKGPRGIEPSNGTTRLSERACIDYTRIGSTDFRMFNGVPAQRDKFPWMAALGYLKERKKAIVCAGDSNHEKDACRGDSGGPIQIFKENAPVATVIGVVSFGRGCPSMLPGIYTRVSYFLDWIEENVW